MQRSASPMIAQQRRVLEATLALLAEGAPLKPVNLAESAEE
ncbi:MAG: hypothetical protein R2867_06935 [Caldilineaceae bacterium]